MAQCGTNSGYTRGCRCDDCRGAAREYYLANKEKYAERARRWAAKQPASYHRERWRRWREANRDKASAQTKKWRARNPEKARVQDRRQRLRRDVGLNQFALMVTDILRADPCSYCGEPLPIHIDHIHPMAHGGASDWSNLTAACERCNKRKSTKPLLRFLLREAA
jgi:5-methylcytosine-specific restriction endonuclease McrA